MSLVGIRLVANSVGSRILGHDPFVRFAFAAASTPPTLSASKSSMLSLNLNWWFKSFGTLISLNGFGWYEIHVLMSMGFVVKHGTRK